VTTAGASCKLLSHTADDVAAALQPAADKPYPLVQPSFVAVNGSTEKSLSWLCLKHQQDWDDFGATTYRTIKPHAAGKHTHTHTHTCWLPAMKPVERRMPEMVHAIGDRTIFMGRRAALPPC
jgi:hypothetical protein